MHKLDRNTVQPPACLNNCDYRTHSWSDFDSGCKRQLRNALVTMQGIPGVTKPDADEYGLRCAYCEAAIFNEGHIEHFRRKRQGHYPELTFMWENLFLACGSREHCGHYKDKYGTPYNPDELIKPDELDASDYLYFDATGHVNPKPNLTAEGKRRATETIRVFCLNAPVLVGKRRKAIEQLREKILSDLEELESWPPEERQGYLLDEIEHARWEPYSTAIQHFLQSRF